jgi:DNA-binding XRE family transcriptional regulator
MSPKLNLIQKRKEHHLKQSEMADFLKITARHYRALEAGTSDGSVKIWQQLAQKFNTTIDYLLEQADPRTTKAALPDGQTQTDK